MFNKLKFSVARLLIKFFGNIQFFKAPLFCLLWGDANYKIKGDETRVIIGLLKAGDIVFRKYDRYISGMFIPGFWTHVGLVVGDGTTIVHASHRGVIEEDVLTFLRTDYVKVVRMPGGKGADEAAEMALSMKGREYDFIFDTTDDSRLYCSELVKYCYPGAFNKVGSEAFPPDDILKADLEIAHDSIDYRKQEG